MSTKHSKFYRLLSLLLVCTLLFEMLPANALAVDEEEAVNPADTPEAAVETIEPAEMEPIESEDQEEVPQATVLGEMEELREENVKHFRMSDGNYLAVSYGGQIHYQDEEGTWQNIDNTLTLRNTEEMATMGLDHTKQTPAVYEAVNGDQVRQFAASVQGDGYLFTAKSGEHSVSMFAELNESNSQSIASAAIENADETETSTLSALEPFTEETVEISDDNNSSISNAAERISVTAEISNPVSTFAQLGEEEKRELPISKQVEPEKITSTVTYSDVWQDTDLIYQPNGMNVKESILVQQEQPSYEYTFRMNTEGLVATLESDGSILLTDQENTPVFEIPAPYMEDANGAVSEDASYTLSEDESGYILTVTANADWMNDEARVWPIVIDPTVIFRSNANNPNILTSYVNSGRTSSASDQNKRYIRSGYYTNTSYDASCTGYTVGLIYINSLPPVPADCVVTDAYLEFSQVLYGGLDNLNYHRIYATTITQPSNPTTYLSTMTWNNYISNILPKYAKTSDGTTTASLDYAKEYARTSTAADKRMYYSITSAAQKWYNNDTSISRLLVLDDGHSNATNARITYAGYNYGTTGYEPKMYVTYRDTTGLSDIYSYHTQNIGRAGIGYVNDYSLNLTLSVPVASAPSEALPFDVSLIYNSSLSNTQFTGASTLIESEDFTSGQTGYGWKTSVQQTVCPVYITNGDSTKTHLVYVDADGTEHYFYPKNGTSTTTYEDEDGLGLTITKTSSSLYTMKDKDGNTWEFTYGFLTQYTSSEGNILYYAYDGVDYVNGSTSWKPSNRTSPHRVTSVWRRNSGASSYRIATLNYNTSNQLSSIKDFADRTTTLSYSNGKLTTITYPDGKTATYEYTQRNGYQLMTKAMDNESGYTIYYTYADNTIRILDIKEYVFEGVGSVPGQMIRAWKQNATYTRFRYYRPGETSDDTGKLITQHYFDNWGRTINTVTLNADESEIFGVTAGAYTQNEGTSKKNNRMTSAASGGIQSTNLLLNSGVESETKLQAWTQYSTGDADSNAWGSTNTATNVFPHSGKYLMKMYTYDMTIGSEIRAQPVFLEKDKTYVFSAYVNTACAQNIAASGGAYLAFRLDTGNVIEEWKTSRKVNYKTDISMDGGWERIEVAFTPPSTTKYQVAAISTGVQQIVAFDDFQLEEVPNTFEEQDPDEDLNIDMEDHGTASNINLLQMSSFELPNSSTGAQSTSYVSQWWKTDTGSNVATSNAQKHAGTYSIKFEPKVDGLQRIRQTVNINATSNRAYLLSGWGWTPPTNIGDGKDLEGDNSNERRFFGMIAKVVYEDGGIEADYHYVPFNDDVSGWQFASGVVVPKERDETVKEITVTLATDYCANRTYMDDISLVAEPVQTYEYDDEGNLVSSTESEGKTQSETDDKDRLTEYTALNGVKYTLTYEDDESRNPETVTSDGVVTSYTYDAGNVTSTKVQKTGDSLYLESSTIYNDSKNFPKSATDVNGTVVSYSYNDTKGLLNSTTTPLGTVINQYNAQNDRLTSTYQTGVVALNYTYDYKGSLDQIKRKTFRNGAEIYQAYEFDYNDWGQKTEINIRKATSPNNSDLSSGIMLASYEYDNEYRESKMIYGNGDSITYEYDLLDRPIRKVYYNDDETVQAEYLYVYSADGQLAKQYAISGGNVVEEYSFEYDSLGRLIRSREDKGSSNVQRTEHLYDTANRLTKQSWQLGTRSYSETYTYNDDVSTNTTGLKDGSLATMKINPLNKTLSFTYDSLKHLDKVTVPGVYVQDYDYTTISGNRSSNLVSRVGYSLGSSSAVGLYYDYIYNSAGNITSIKQNGNEVASYKYDAQGQLISEDLGSTEYLYTYDTAGNILSVDVSGIGNYKTFTYNNDDWQDLLTSIKINGTTKNIAYEGQSYNASTNVVSGTPVFGNPINWYNGNNLIDLEWSQGRRLMSLKKKVGTSTETDISYTYDMSGVRTSKKVGSDTYNFVTQNGQVVRQTWGSKILDIVYDNNGQPFALCYSTNGGSTFTDYYYITNSQGDVVRLVNSAGSTAATYTYDAWGKVTVTNYTGHNNIGTENPIRYRGYYYDTETGWYYLQSRYYDPTVGRFINADNAIAAPGSSVQGYNMFLYCFNNPVNMTDNSGTWPSWNDIKAGFEKAVDWVDNNIIQPVEDFFKKTIDYLTPPSKEDHYNRNQNNVQFPEEYDEIFFKEWDNGVSANCHQFSAPNRDNVKYVSPDGRYEAIYDVNNKLVTDPRDVGTYNFVSPNEDPIGHAIKDVIPWIRYGNSPDDSTEWWQRAQSLIGIYE